jgi:methyl-accepting chemotaxis protein
MTTWYGNLTTRWKLMLGFALIGLLTGLLGGIAGNGLTTLRESLRVVYEDYTVAGTDLATVANNLNRTRTNDFLALEAATQEDLDRVVALDAEIMDSVKKPLSAYAATVLRISKSGRNETKDLQTFREAYAAYVAASDLSFEILKRAWAAPTKQEMEALQAKARANTMQNSGPKMEATIVALNELLFTVKAVAQDMNEEGKAAAANALGILAIGTAGVIAGGLLLGWLTARFLSRNLADVVQAVQAIGGGNLRARSSVTSTDEVGALAQGFNTMGETLQGLMAAVHEAAEGVSSGAEEITAGNEDLAQRTCQQAASLEETSASMEEMTSTVKQNADNAKQANQLAIEAREVANAGGAVTSRAVEAMGEINQSSKKIADIITVIDEIAFQTNLLALNAAVEAARAGEHGRGFAVVAAEVRNLAQRSATAAKEIKGLINESLQRVSDGTELVNQSGKTLNEIVTSVKRVTDIIAEISAASQEQATGADQVNRAIIKMDAMTQQNAALVEEAASASQSLKEQARELNRKVASFQTPGSGQVTGTGSVTQRAVPVPSKQAPRWGQTPRADAKKGISHQADGKKGVSPQLVGVAVGLPAAMQAGNGHDRRSKEENFEEF